MFWVHMFSNPCVAFRKTVGCWSQRDAIQLVYSAEQSKANLKHEKNPIFLNSEAQSFSLGNSHGKLLATRLLLLLSCC